MRKIKKIKLIFNEFSHNSLILFWTLIDKDDKEDKKEYFNFYNILFFYIEKNKIKLNKKVIISLKPFIKIAELNIKYFNNKKINFKKSLKITKKVVLIKYKGKIIYVFPYENKKYTHAINEITYVNFIYFFLKFIENWNKYQNTFKIKLKDSKISNNNEEKKYIDYFENYYDNLK
ncbi:hypothetical protein [Spiroplasma endosymbiont of Polydrusus pterygomalis]|uniref:hypothetical protein n=1 Tax=Spiroplasma endosymbiont of Polydrusus pterygomalis TaxID=3139327 RepID=UPI003CCA9591